MRQLRTELKATSAADSGISCCRTWYVPGMYIVTCDSLEFINKLGVQRSMPVTQQKNARLHHTERYINRIHRRINDAFGHG